MPDQIDQHFRQLMGEVRSTAPQPAEWEEMSTRHPASTTGASRVWLAGAVASVLLLVSLAFAIQVGRDDTDQLTGSSIESTQTSTAPTTAETVTNTFVTPTVGTVAVMPTGLLDAPPPEPEPALVLPTPTAVDPGETVALTFPTEVDRGTPWYMYSTSSSTAWADDPSYLLIATSGGYDCGGCQRWVAAGDGFGWDHIRFSGPGPDSIIIPDTASGLYRVCSANERNASLCFQILVEKASTPNPDPGEGLRLVIGAIGVDVAVGVGVDEASLRERPGLDPEGSEVGDTGVARILGNRTTYQAEFRNLDLLEPGDSVEVSTVNAMHLYRVDSVDVVVHGTPAPTSEAARLLLSANAPKGMDDMELRVLATLVEPEAAGGPAVGLAPGTEIAFGLVGAPVNVPQPWPVGTIFRGAEPDIVTVSFVPPDPSCIAGHATATIGRAGAVLISVYVEGDRDSTTPCVNGAERAEIRLSIDDAQVTGNRFYSSTIPESAGATAAAEAVADQIIGLSKVEAVSIIEDAGFVVRDNTGMDAVNSDRNLGRVNIIVVDRTIEWAAVG
jgi:hypothetical protein